MFSDNYKRDPWGHGGSGSGHFIVGLVLWLVAGLIWPVAGYLDPLLIGVSYFLVVELAGQRLALFWDGLEDTGHVTFGAGFGYILTRHGTYDALAVLVGWGAVLLFGMWRRS
jgi:hypothetical protein